jgi:hypothetical protein
LKLPIAGDSPEQEAAGKRQEVEFLRQVSLFDLRRQLAKGLKAQEILYPGQGSSGGPEERRCPGGAEILLFLFRSGKDAETRLEKVGPIFCGLPVGFLQEAAEKTDSSFRSNRLIKGGIEPFPEGAGRPLFASSEESPANPPLIILGAGKGQG